MRRLRLEIATFLVKVAREKLGAPVLDLKMLRLGLMVVFSQIRVCILVPILFVFISYSHTDRLRAAQVQELLDDLGIESFMAHEDIAVSQEWRIAIMNALDRADAFVCLLSDAFYQSEWCLQETGVASFKAQQKGMPFVPLALDESIPKGSFSHIQSIRVGDEITLDHIAPGLFRSNEATDILIDYLGNSYSFAQAESRMRLLTPHFSLMDKQQAERLIQKSSENNQIYGAWGCERPLKELLSDYSEKWPEERFPPADNLANILETMYD